MPDDELAHLGPHAGAGAHELHAFASDPELGVLEREVGRGGTGVDHRGWSAIHRPSRTPVMISRATNGPSTRLERTPRGKISSPRTTGLEPPVAETACRVAPGHSTNGRSHERPPRLER